MSILLSLCTVLCSVVVSVTATTRAGVDFNARGVTGYVSFTETSEGDIAINTFFTGLQSSSDWSVHTLPVDQTVEPDKQCEDGWIGSLYDPFQVSTTCTQSDPESCQVGDFTGKFGPLPSYGGRLSVTDRNLSLSGQYSIVGRSFVVQVSESERVCGTIRSDTEGRTDTLLSATFVYPLAGTVYFRQKEGEDAQVWGKLYWVNGRLPSTPHNWHIHENPTNQYYRIGNANKENCGSDVIGGHYNPFDAPAPSSPQYMCSPSDITECEVGDLTGKHSALSVDGSPSPYSTKAFFYTDSFLNLTGEYSVAGRSIAIHDDTGHHAVVACAPLVVAEELQITAPLVDTEGRVALSQAGPLENTVITTPLASSLSVLDAAFSPDTICPIEESPYNPYNIVDSPDDVCRRTPDQFPLGDLSSRLGGAKPGQFEAYNTPIFGSLTTLNGKVLRVVSESTRVCSALLPTLGDSVRMAKASFDSNSRPGGVSGAIYMMQQQLLGDVALGHTFITVDIYYTDMSEETCGHNWHIHVNPPQDDTSPCQDSIGGHYNPFNVTLGDESNYASTCSPMYPLRCESGDLSGKHGQLCISPKDAMRKTYTFVDNNINLFGDYSVLGRSIGLHLTSEDGGGLFDCAEVKRVYLSKEISKTVGLETKIVDYKKMLADSADVEPSDILVLQQIVTDGSDEATLNMKVLGATEPEAEDNSQTVLNSGGVTWHCSLALLLACLLAALGLK